MVPVFKGHLPSCYHWNSPLKEWQEEESKLVNWIKASYQGQVTKESQGETRGGGLGGESISEDVQPAAWRFFLQRDQIASRSVSQISALPPLAGKRRAQTCTDQHTLLAISGVSQSSVSMCPLPCYLQHLNTVFIPWTLSQNPSSASPLAANVTGETGFPQALSVKAWHRSALGNLVLQTGRRPVFQDHRQGIKFCPWDDHLPPPPPRWLVSERFSSHRGESGTELSERNVRGSSLHREPPT